LFSTPVLFWVFFSFHPHHMTQPSHSFAFYIFRNNYSSSRIKKLKK
jgi:hypothetical protein